ncbi:unnamed protein product [Brachionus calyciflorus]|uniref:Uncharacterized protein n=1 Tax=Brachionus calyciflorus TaxID=104777 RepID=A0A814CXB3_9BILA|nr:unnamed protein product [Brachionus calyciflorus]
MEISEVQKFRGRSFAGKCWLVKKEYKVSLYDFDLGNFSQIKIKFKDKNLTLLGVWIPFDDRSLERIANFNLNLAESFLENSESEIILMGDCNSDLGRNKRYDIILNEFVVKNDLIDLIRISDNLVDIIKQKGNSAIKTTEEVVKMIDIVHQTIPKILLKSAHTRFCVDANLGAIIDSTNLSIIGYCDDIIILSPIAFNVQTLLSKITDYSKKWIIEFNASKSAYMSYNEDIVLQNYDFKIGGKVNPKQEGIIYLGIPIGD